MAFRERLDKESITGSVNFIAVMITIIAVEMAMITIMVLDTSKPIGLIGIACLSSLFVITFYRIVKKIALREIKINNHIVDLEDFIRQQMFAKMNEGDMEKFSSQVITMYAQGDVELPDNMLSFICENENNFQIFRSAVIEKIEVLSTIQNQKKEWENYCRHQAMNKLLLERRNVEGLLATLDETYRIDNPPNLVKGIKAFPKGRGGISFV